MGPHPGWSPQHHPGGDQPLIPSARAEPALFYPKPFLRGGEPGMGGTLGDPKPTHGPPHGFAVPQFPPGLLVGAAPRLPLRSRSRWSGISLGEGCSSYFHVLKGKIIKTNEEEIGSPPPPLPLPTAAGPTGRAPQHSIRWDTGMGTHGDPISSTSPSLCCGAGFPHNLIFPSQPGRQRW